VGGRREGGRKTRLERWTLATRVDATGERVARHAAWLGLGLELGLGLGLRLGSGLGVGLGLGLDGTARCR